MENNTHSGLLQINISSTDHIKQTPLYEFIVYQAKKLELPQPLRKRLLTL